MAVLIDISVGILRLLQMICLIISIGPYISVLIRAGDQMVLFVICINAAVTPFILCFDQVIIVIIPVQTFRSVPFHHFHRKISIVIENLFFRAVRIRYTIHTPARVIGHLCNIAQRVHTFDQSSFSVIAVLNVISFRFNIGNAACLIIPVAYRMSKLISKDSPSVIFIIGNMTVSSACRILLHNSAPGIILIDQIDLSGKIRHG